MAAPRSGIRLKPLVTSIPAAHLHSTTNDRQHHHEQQPASPLERWAHFSIKIAYPFSAVSGFLDRAFFTGTPSPSANGEIKRHRNLALSLVLFHEDTSAYTNTRTHTRAPRVIPYKKRLQVLTNTNRISRSARSNSKVATDSSSTRPNSLC